MYVAVIFFSLISLSSYPILAQKYTSASGIIASNTTWTRANSPYTLSGPILVNKSVTLTVEPGVIVNLNGNYIQVDGTLQAKGSDNEYVTLNGDPQFPNNGITFTSSSTSWNQKTGSGCIIEKTILNSVKISIGNSAKINNNTMNGGYIDTAITVSSSFSPIITSNKITGGLPYETAITVSGLAIVSNNIIASTNNIAILAYDSTVISNNVISGL